ncbi:hypothetical protein ACFL27_04985 [candidate division CSSED10-310 bacterium]|uniref:Uncharacterized protein n=1 Tax=candidate division CSSED10-310 bacterium TaxID=2855610 RepID=A0ABV6YTM6_UNCC1
MQLVSTDVTVESAMCFKGDLKVFWSKTKRPCINFPFIHRNPLRGGLVKRLADYNWSSYRAYAYGQCSVDWLHREAILARYSGETIPEKQQNYRIAVQEYSEEEQSLLENIRLGFILGSKQFVQSIRHRFYPGQRDPEIPEQRKIQKSNAPIPAELLVAAADYLDCDIQAIKNSLRIPRHQKAARDLLLYFICYLAVLLVLILARDCRSEKDTIDYTETDPMDSNHEHHERYQLSRFRHP